MICGELNGKEIFKKGWEDPLEKEMAAHSSILVWRIPWQRSLVGYIQYMGSQSQVLSN